MIADCHPKKHWVMMAETFPSSFDFHRPKANYFRRKGARKRGKKTYAVGGGRRDKEEGRCCCCQCCQVFPKAKCQILEWKMPDLYVYLVKWKKFECQTVNKTFSKNTPKQKIKFKIFNAKQVSKMPVLWNLALKNASWQHWLLLQPTSSSS